VRNSLVETIAGCEVCCTATTLIIKKGDQVIKLVKSSDKELLQEEKTSFIEALQSKRSV